MVSWILSTLMFATIGAPSDCTIVYFGSSNCKFCEQITPSLDQLSRGGWNVQRIDAPSQTELAKQFRIRNLPTIIFLKDGKELDRIIGAAPYEQITSRLNRALSVSQASTQSQQTTATNAPIVRGQSPAGGGFPMLASNSVVSAAATANLSDFAQTVPTPPSMQSIPASNMSMAPSRNEPTTPTLSLEQAVARAAAATVRIRVDETSSTAFGTGTIIDVQGNEALVLTCGHLFRDMRPGSRLTVDLFAGTPRETNVYAQLIDFKAEGEDIGLVSLQLPVAIEPVEVLPKNETLQVGQAVFSFGCDHGDDPTLQNTSIRSINRYIGAANVEIAGAPAVGRSGGGLFDQQGRLIGVCNAADATDNEGIYAAAQVVYSQIERLGLSHLFDSSSAPSAFASANLPKPVNSPAANGMLVSGAATPASSSLAQDQMQWPDESAPGMAQIVSQVGGPVQATARGPAQASAQELICILKDSLGNNRVMRIENASPTLLQQIEQYAQ